MFIDFSNYLSGHIDDLIALTPIKEWKYSRLIRGKKDGLDSTQIFYVFESNGLEIICNEDDYVVTVFLQSQKLGGFDDSLVGGMFQLQRAQVREKFGNPFKSQVQVTHSILGQFRAWDLFWVGSSAMNVTYRLDQDQIESISYMLREVLPT